MLRENRRENPSVIALSLSPMSEPTFKSRANCRVDHRQTLEQVKVVLFGPSTIETLSQLKFLPLAIDSSLPSGLLTSSISDSYTRVNALSEERGTRLNVMISLSIGFLRFRRWTKENRGEEVRS